MSFNSKMVRLKVGASIVFTFAALKFQFQNGAIKRKRKEYRAFVFTRFNSKMVRLKAKVREHLITYYQSFNSKMVRLKAAVRWVFYQFLRPFQFQNGAIKSHGSKTVTSV